MKFRDYLNKLTDEEFDELMYAIYYSGVKDGDEGIADSPTNSFSSTYSERTALDNVVILEEVTEIPVYKTYVKKVGEK